MTLAGSPLLPFEHWSWSKISLWLRCPQRFRFEYIERVQRQHVSVALLLGSAVHGALCLFHARVLQGETPSTAAIEQQVEDLLRSSIRGSDVPVTYSKTEPDLEAAVLLSRQLIRTYLDSPRSGTVLAVEKELLTAVPGVSLPLVGVLDRIDRDPSGGVVVVELKTAGRAWSEEEASLHGQATTYAALMGSLGRPVRIRFEVLTKTKVPRLQAIETQRDSSDVERLMHEIRMVERAVKAGAFPRNQSPLNCSSCPYRRPCLGDRQSASFQVR
jgi:putative RecB family exonuclease